MGKNRRRSARAFICPCTALIVRMSPLPANLAIYESICAVSSQMVDAARENDWDRLVTLERQVAELRHQLQPYDELPLSMAEIEHKRNLIQRILDDDAEVRRHTEPWMEQVRRFLGAGTAQRKLEHAYGAMR